METKNFSRLRTEENEAQRVVGEIDRFVIAVVAVVVVRLIKRRNRRNAIRTRLETVLTYVNVRVLRIVHMHVRVYEIK